MTGLIKNNLYASLDNIKWYTVIMTLLGIFAAVIYDKNPMFLNNFTLVCVAGFSINAIFGLQKELSSKWNKYKLTTPVTRTAIIKSYYICHILWMLAGVFFASVWIGLALILHGFLFDKTTDYVMVLAAPVCIGFLTGAIFYPLFYSGKSERYEAILITGLLGAFLLLMGAVWLINYFFAPMTDLQIILAAILLILVSLYIFILSYHLTVRIFRRKDY